MSQHRLLIANRGEIARRIIRTARRMGIATVAVYSDPDARAPHALEADQAFHIGPAAASQSYLNQERLLEVAEEAGATLVHPGYGFLSENTDFAQRCESRGIRFVGPPAQAIAAMGDKTAAKNLMEEAGVPLVPGYHGQDQSLAILADEAQRIGMPVLIKASAGGGGKGMRVVREAPDLEQELEAARREAKSAFGNDQVLLERYVEQPRHVEVQVFFDQHGHGVYLFDRDCSIQRRHQKIIEEAPAPGLTEATRQAMGEAAVRCGQAINYVGAGTVEFLLDPGGEFFFMEMNTRLQVEHPVTEAITALDLVEWQLRVALGDPLPWAQAELGWQGHAVEARVYAEDPDHGFLPTAGPIQWLEEPESHNGVRVDSGIAAGLSVTSDYDPMLAKVIAHAGDRDQAIEKLIGALEQYRLAGLTTNTGYLCRILDHQAFRDGALRTDFTALHEANLSIRRLSEVELQGLGLIGWLWHQPCPAPDSTDPWDQFTGWRLSGEDWQRAEVHTGERQVLRYALQDDPLGGQLVKVRVEETEIHCRISGTGNSRQLRWSQAGRPDRALMLTAISKPPASVVLFARGECWSARVNHPEMDLAEADTGSLTAPMHGRVVALHCSEGQAVAAGAPLVVMEAMKMEHSLVAPEDGTVSALHCAVGSTLSTGHVLLEFEAHETEGEA